MEVLLNQVQNIWIGSYMYVQLPVRPRWQHLVQPRGEIIRRNKIIFHITRHKITDIMVAVAVKMWYNTEWKVSAGELSGNTKMEDKRCVTKTMRYLLLQRTEKER